MKFRAWDKKLKRFVGAVLIDLNGKPDRSGLIIQQFIGLKDANKKEIYEGDIIKTKEHLAVIRWNKMFAFFEANFRDGDEIQIWEARDGIIIGNIYENPELLND